MTLDRSHGNEVSAGLAQAPAPSGARWAEPVMPQAVLEITRFLDDRGVWHVLSRNPEARSCRDAARKRVRAGRVGIPLYDEMKTFFGRLVDDAAPRYVMVHCRGDCRLALPRVAAALGSSKPIERVDSDELARFGLAYGRVNPFTVGVSALTDEGLTSVAVQHVFDIDLLDPRDPPGTVMTNAGELTWAVEFRAHELFAATGRRRLPWPDPSHEAVAAVCAPVAIADPAAPPRPEHRHSW